MKATTVIWVLGLLLTVGCAGVQLNDDDAIEVFRGLCDDLAAQLLESGEEKPEGPIAILCTYDKEKKFCGRRGEQIADTLTTAFSKRGALVVDRPRVEQLIAEQTWQNKPIYDDKTTAEMGRLLGAKQIALGMSTQLAGRTVVSYRLVDAATGKVISTADKDLLPELESRLWPKGLKGIYRIKRLQLEIEQTAYTGDYWDVGGVEAPADPYAKIRFGDGNSVHFGKKSNTLNPRWISSDSDKSMLFNYDPRNPIELIVYDRDVIDDDFVGRFTWEHGFPEDQLERGRIQVKDFGKIKLATIELERVR